MGIDNSDGNIVVPAGTTTAVHDSYMPLGGIFLFGRKIGIREMQIAPLSEHFHRLVDSRAFRQIILDNTICFIFPEKNEKRNRIALKK